MMVKETIRKYPNNWEDSAKAEIAEMIARKVFSPVEHNKLKDKNIKLVKSFLFFKEKFDIHGELERLKARLVAMDNSHESSLHSDKSSPVARLESILMTLAIAGAEGRKIIGIDVGNAYLEAEMTGDEVYVELDAFVASILKDLDESVKKYINEKGKLIVKLDKALYGCVQSAKLWYNKLRSVLENIGFEANPHDVCLFNKIRNDKQITVCCYVDDLLCTSSDNGNLTWICEELKKAFKKLTIKDEPTFEFVSFEISQREEGLQVQMSKYIKSLLEEWGV